MKAPPRDSYLRVALLSGVVLLGWIWDFALGGGRAHAVGWLIALLVVAAVMTLVIRSARSERLPDPASAVAISAPEGAAAGEPDTSTAAGGAAPAVRPAGSADRRLLAEVQLSSAAVFTVSGLAAPPPVELPAEAVLFAAGEPAIGFLALTVVDGDAHVAGVWVVPGSMRRGVGSALLRAAERYAVQHGAQHGWRRVTLLVSEQVPWQSGFFARHGYRPIEPGRELTAALAGRPSRTVALGKALPGDVDSFGAAGTMTG